MTAKEIIQRFAKENNMSYKEAEHQILVASKKLDIPTDNIIKFM